MQPVTRLRIFGIRLGLIVLGLYWLLLFTGTHLPKIPSIIPTTNDKVMHFSAFFGLATLLCYCTNSRKTFKRFGIIIAVCLVYAIFDELTQSLVRGRESDWLDFVADSAGTFCAVGFYALGRAVWMRNRSTTSSSCLA